MSLPAKTTLFACFEVLFDYSQRARCYSSDFDSKDRPLLCLGHFSGDIKDCYWPLKKSKVSFIQKLM
ncbi:unnamed protein product [Acanthoscelides obtectus]|uniref:Uncharacterized protein n=1 Tax=Acanthoscelides obtectus TaxID=200917 RepID=A0A9P0JYX4_ACAOB|nr:unnamed protein product [Acanthoscelides obtectus]CAK1640750.1 hypothetical protein AOBTE_LOCUS11911 [Acanthoscelides obtectus]